MKITKTYEKFLVILKSAGAFGLTSIIGLLKEKQKMFSSMVVLNSFTVLQFKLYLLYVEGKVWALYPDCQVTFYLCLLKLDLKLLLNWGQHLWLKYSQCSTILKQHFLVYRISVDSLAWWLLCYCHLFRPYCLGIRAACGKVQKLALSLSVSFPNHIYAQWYISVHSWFCINSKPVTILSWAFWSSLY